MQPLSAWVFLFIASSLADWTLNSPSGVSVDGDPVLQSPPEGNTINNYPVTNELPTSTTDGVINLAQVPLDQNNGLANMAAEPSTFEIANGCSPQQPGKKRRTRRDGEMCAPGDSLKNPNNNPSQLTDSHPKNPKTREAPSANASPRRYIPPLDPEAKQLLPLFLPKQSWPSEDDSVCREGGYRTPVCAPQSADDMGVSSSYDFVNFLDPCSPCTCLVSFLPAHNNPQQSSFLLCWLLLYISMDV